MSQQVGTYTIGLDTPIHLLTPRQLFEMQKEWMSSEHPQAETGTPRKWYVYSHLPDFANGTVIFKNFTRKF